MRQSNAKPTAINSNTGKQWTEEEKAAYAKSQERAFANFAKYFRGNTDPKARVGFRAKVIELAENPSEYEHPHFGPMGPCSLVKVELVDKPVVGLRFQAQLTDKPNTIQNSKSALNHLYRAATGQPIPEHGPFNWDTQDILHEEVGGTGRYVLAMIARGNDRSDGQRGGLWSELKDFAPYVAPPSFEDEEENDADPTYTPAPSGATVTSVTRKRVAPAATPSDPELEDEDEDNPFA